MILKNDEKSEEELTCRFKIDIKESQADFHCLSFITSKMKSETPQNFPRCFTIFRTPTLVFPLYRQLFSNLYGKTGDGRGEISNGFFFVGEC